VYAKLSEWCGQLSAAQADGDPHDQLVMNFNKKDSIERLDSLKYRQGLSTLALTVR